MRAGLTCAEKATIRYPLAASRATSSAIMRPPSSRSRMRTSAACGPSSPVTSATTWVTVMRCPGSALIQDITPSTTTG